MLRPVEQVISGHLQDRCLTAHGWLYLLSWERIICWGQLETGRDVLLIFPSMSVKDRSVVGHQSRLNAASHLAGRISRPWSLVALFGLGIWYVCRACWRKKRCAGTRFDHGQVRPDASWQLVGPWVCNSAQTRERTWIVPTVTNGCPYKACRVCVGKFHQLVRNRFEPPSLLDSEKLDCSSLIVVMWL
jgi:hypothetical protein